jgi:hypothetical protein
LEALTRSHFTALRRRLEVYPPRSAQKQHGRKNSHNGVPENLLSVLVDNNRPTNKDRHARNSSWPGALCSTEGRIHLRRLVTSPSAFSLQSDGGPYIYRQVILKCDSYGLRVFSWTSAGFMVSISSTACGCYVNTVKAMRMQICFFLRCSQIH